MDRHPDESKRQSFLNIVVALQKPDFQILKWPESEGDGLSRTLGADLHHSNELYLDLQNKYKKKHRRTFTRKSSVKSVSKPDVEGTKTISE